MSDAGTLDRLAALTPEQRELLEILRRKKAALAAVAANTAKRARRPPTAPPIPRRPEGPGPWPLSFDQERLWFLYYLDPEATAYNIDTSTRMRGRLDVAALVRALNAVVRRHEAWRTSFHAVDGRPVQTVAPDLTLSVSVVDLRRVPLERREAVTRAHQRSEARRPFDLTRAPLVRSLLLRLEDDLWTCMLTVHHIVTDWVTFQLFWRELAILYTAFVAPAAPPPFPLPEIPRQYADFAVWQRDWLQGEALDTYLDFWLQELADAPQVLDLPLDRPRPATQTTRGGEQKVEIPGARADALKALARQVGASPFMAVMATFKALLFRLTGQEKVLIGSPNANRNQVELEPAFGFFLTQLVFATDGAGNPTFRELLSRVRRAALGAYSHQDLPFGKLLEALKPERDNSRPPLIQANFLLLDSEYTPMALPDLEVVPIWVDDGNSRFDMTLGLWDSPQRIFGFFEYNLDLFDRTTVARMGEAFEAITERVVADPELRLSDLPLLSIAARHQVLAEWNDTGEGWRGPAVPALLAARAAERPEALGVVCGEVTLTHGDLDRAAEREAGRLRAAGVGKGDVVGLALDRSAALPVGVLAIWKVGAVLLPLDPAAPKERLAFLVEDAGARAILTREPLRPRLPETALPVLILATQGVGEGLAPSRVGELDPADAAYLLYTSGTTGQPKGVVVEHGNLSAILAACQREFAFTAADRLLAVAPFSFDIFFFELLSPLLAGGTTEILAATSPLDLDALLAGLRQATRFHAVPALLRQILPALEREGPAPFAGLRTLFTGGDAVPADLVAGLVSALPGTELRVLYGPTEATILATSERVDTARNLALRVGTPLGRPLPGVRLRVVDPTGGLAAIGVAGELWIGGAGVTRGYLGRDELTHERFITANGLRWYRTGDRVRQRADGALEFLGRVDAQVKIRGFRVEPGEVEAALRDLPGVAEAAVVAREVAGGDKQLVAYVVPRPGREPRELRAETLGERLRERLPGHMVPSLFVPLASLPLTSHGKVDPKALPDPAAVLAGETGEADPRDEREAALAEVWQEVLGLPRVGIHDNFFQLGGDSILSIQMVARARKAGLLLTPKQLFEHQTIAALAAVAGRAGVAEADQAPVAGEAPLTPIERRFFTEARPEPWRFNQALLFASRAALYPRLLTLALDTLVDHHDALRLRFTQDGESWKQWHAPAGMGAPLLAVDLFALPPERTAETIEAAVEALQGAFDLGDLRHGPLFLAALFQGGPGGEDRLLVAAHHLVVDGVSWRILLEDLETAYDRLAAGELPALPAKTTSFKSWAERLAAHARSAEVKAELRHWTSLPEVPPVPVDFPGGDNRAGTAASVAVELTAEETRALLREAPAAYRTRVDELLLAALARALASFTKGERVLLDVEGHGREEALLDPAGGIDLSRTVGWFTTLYPVALDLRGAAEPGAAIKAVKEQLRAIPGKGLGYGLLRWLGDERTADLLAALPAPEVSFNYLGQADPSLAGAALLSPAPEAIRGTESPRARRAHLLEVSGIVLGERLRLDLSYSTALHRPETVESLAQGFLAELRTLVAHCLSPGAFGYTPADFPLARLSQGDLDALLAGERGIADLYPLAPLQQGMLFHTLFTPGSELYFEQLTATLRGALDLPAFTRAWQRALDRHPALRAAFLWEGLSEPLQAVRCGVILDWQLLDWQDAGSAADLERRWTALAAADRRRGFDLARPPLLRLTLVRTGPSEHRLLWSFHHLLFDGWCFSLLFSEVFTLYAGFVERGEEPPLPPVHPYADYIAWLERRDPLEAETFWRRTLAGFAAPTPLPLDHPASPPGLAAADYREREITLGEAGAAGVGAMAELAQRLSVTQNVLLQAAWALLLSRFAREADVAFGTVVSGRPADLPGVESIVGLFINTVPVRVEVPAGAGESLAAWLGRLGEAQAERSQHEWTPLARIQAASEVPPGEPLFESLLVFENYPLDPGLAAGVAGLAIDSVAVSERTNYALTLTAAARGGDLSLRLLHDRRTEPATARRLLGHLAVLLEGFVADPGRAPSDLPLLTAAARHQLLVEWAEEAWTEPPLQSPPSVLASFAARVAEDPGALAVAAPDGELSYGELAGRAGRLARRLLALRLPPESVFGLAVGRTTALPVGVLGILQAGAAWLPLDLKLPAERLAFLLADSGARAVVAERATATALPTGDLPVLLVGGPGDTADTAPGPLPRVALEDLAYVLYTSGTTGRPKGVMVEHGSLARVLAASARFLGWERDERVLAVAPFSFDISIWELVKPLTLGAAVQIFPLEPVPDLAQLAEALRQTTRMHAVPALLRQIAEAARAAGGDYPGLRALYMGGEAAPAELQAEILDLFPGIDVRVLYGPTEGTIFCTSARSLPGELRSSPLGRPLPGARLHLADPTGLPLPAGAAGELWLSGSGLARGYLGRPDLTAERFVPGPGGERWYRTGDLARRRPEGTDGELDFLGRTDDQVKVRGVRIELGEIEAALLALPEVREAAVFALPGDRGGRGDRRLAAFVVPGETGFAPDRLAQDLRLRLPEAMVPAVFVEVAALPRTAHGKLDRKALAHLAPPELPVPVGAGAAPPRNAVEAALAAVWRSILGIERVGIDDNFFRLGGDSILSLQVVSRARQAGLVFTPRQLFEHPTIAELAQVASAARPGRAEQEPVTGEAPLTPIQRRFLETTEGRHLHRFAQAVLLDLEGAGPAAPPLLARALAALAGHHDALRLRFTHPGQSAESGWRQAHAAVGEEVPCPAIDLSALPEDRFGRAVTAAAESLEASFDIARGPLFLGALLTGGEGRRRLLLAAHHLVVDTVSWRILLEDLETAWGHLAAGSPVRLPEKTTSYKAWATGLTLAAASPDLAADREHWLALDASLEGEAPLALPPELTAAAGPTETVSGSLSPEATEALLRRAEAAYRTRVDDLLLAALALALGGERGERGERGPLLVHLEGHGREDELVPGADLSRTVGWFTSIYPVALDLRGTAGPGEAIRRVKETLRQIPHKGAGYGLLRHLGSAGERERLARFERAHPAAVAWNYLGQLDSPFAGSTRLRLAPEPTGTGQSPDAHREHPLEVNAMVLDGKLRVEWSFASIPGMPAARQAAERLSTAFLMALEALVEHCLSPEAGGYTPSDFPLAALDSGSLDELLGSSRDVEDLYPLTPLQQGMLFHDLYAPGSGLYVQQLACTLAGPLDRAAFRAAWQAVVDRHPVLRTAFLWQGLARPLQAVHRGVALPWEELDLRDTPASSGGELAERLEAIAAERRDRGFDPGRAPLLRMTLVRTGEEEHRFVWTFHHILLDGWCFALLFRDLFALYTAAGPRAAELPPAPPYRDYIAWLERRATAAAAAAERYWRGALAGFAAPTPLPLDRPLAAAGEGGGDLELFLSPELTAGLQALARASELTVNTLFQGAWALLLSRYTGGRGGGGGGDVVFGTVVSGRPPELPGVETMVGLFINTLPVRLAPAPAAPAGAFLREVQARQAEMRQHEHAPLADVQRLSDVPPGEPLFQSLFVFENFPVDSSLGQGAGDLAIRDVRLEDRADYPLGIAAGPAEGGRRLGLRIAYDGHLEQPTVERLGRHLIALLAGFAEGGADRPLGDIPLLSAAERRQLLAEWGRGPAVEPADVCLHTLFAEQAARTPGAVALLQGERKISYAELDRAAAALARRLRGLGVGPEVKVPLLAGRSPEAIVGIVAVLAAGGAYVPLDPAAPADRLALLLAEIRGATPALPLLTTADAASRFLEPADAARAGLHPVLLEDLLASPAPEETLSALPPSGAGPESLAYVIYTSGSTGNPKGVMVSHRAIATYVRTVVALHGMGPGDREIQASSLTFDPSVEEIFAPLASGGAVVLPEGPFEEPARFLDFCRRTELTILSLPTAYWHSFVATLAAESLPVPPRVRRVIMGGERALPERWAAWGEGTWAEVPLLNGYGPTEATVVATLETHPGPEPLSPGREVPIGRPLPGVAVRVLAAAASPEPLPPGAVGELHLGGVSLARGYLGDPALTAERFVPDPWGEPPGARLYRTGDLVRFLPDGRLEFLGRADAQVKVRGFRIELGEVEAALAAHPALLEAAAGTRTDASGSQRLVAWVVPRNGELPDAQALRQFLAGRLPAYMIPTPSDIAFLPALPRNASDKVDRRALAQLVQLVQLAPAPRMEGEGYVPPRNAMEEELAGLFREILGAEQAGATDDFFALGGHSLLATQLVSRLRRELGIDLPLARIFELRTLESIAGEVLALKLATEGEKVDGLLADLDNLTDEEALALLAADAADAVEDGEAGSGGEEAHP